MKKNKKMKSNEVELIKTTNEETDQVKTFVYILIGVAVVTGLLYFLSTNYFVKDGVKNDDDVAEEAYAYNNVNVGTVFNRSESEYYVFAFDPENLQSSYYSALLNSYKSDKVKMYFMDLSIEINKEYVKDISNSKATKPSELALKSPTLIKIKSGKIDKYLENIEEIEKELK